MKDGQQVSFTYYYLFVYASFLMEINSNREAINFPKS